MSKAVPSRAVSSHRGSHSEGGPGDSADDEEDLRNRLRIALTPGVGPLLFRELLRRFGSAAQVMAAKAEDLERVPRIGRRVIASLMNSSAAEVDAVWESCEQFGIRLLSDRDASYPPLLREIPDAPPILYVRGEVTQADLRCLAIVGSRNATGYGRRMSERFGRELAAAGFTVVSGLARGVDASAHRGAVQGGGRTIAVLGGGVLNIYPPEHIKLAELVETSGALISESPPFHPPRSGSFPRRNRLISGLAFGVIVVEASLRSGALISARLAAEQGREVFALPGRIDSPTSLGCNRLIKDGAKLVESLEDILDELEPLSDFVESHRPTEPTAPPPTLPSRPSFALNRNEQLVLDQTSDEGTPIDEVIRGTRLNAGQVLAAISGLEMHKLVRRLGGAMIAKA